MSNRCPILTDGHLHWPNMSCKKLTYAVQAPQKFCSLLLLWSHEWTAWLGLEQGSLMQFWGKLFLFTPSTFLSFFIKLKCNSNLTSPVVLVSEEGMVCHELEDTQPSWLKPVGATRYTYSWYWKVNSLAKLNPKLFLLEVLRTDRFTQPPPHLCQGHRQQVSPRSMIWNATKYHQHSASIGRIQSPAWVWLDRTIAIAFI